jgi:hypothetical protein
MAHGALRLEQRGAVFGHGHGYSQKGEQQGQYENFLHS